MGMLSIDAEIDAARRTLAELACGDPALVDELTGLLADSLHRSSSGLAAAAAAGSRPGVVQQAHAFRGTALTSGLHGLAGLAERIEVGEVPPADVPVAVAELTALVERVIAGLPGKERP